MPRNTGEFRKLLCCNCLGRMLPLARLRFALHCLTLVLRRRVSWWFKTRTTNLCCSFLPAAYHEERYGAVEQTRGCRLFLIVHPCGSLFCRDQSSLLDPLYRLIYPKSSHHKVVVHLDRIGFYLDFEQTQFPTPY
jgi:hypothetical protein